MAVNTRQANANWNVVNAKGEYYGSYDGAMLAVLMDIRDRLDVLNHRLLLIDSNTKRIDKIARTISRKVPARK